MKELKERILDEGFPVRYYSNPQELSEMVVEDMQRLIEEKYPLHEIESPIEIETQNQLAFAQSRSHFYIGEESTLKELYQFVHVSISA